MSFALGKAATRRFSRSVSSSLTMQGGTPVHKNPTKRWLPVISVGVALFFGLSGASFCSYRTNCLLDDKRQAKMGSIK